MTLTREQILAMQPGRELDALVAERVFGWTRHPKNHLYFPNPASPPIGQRIAQDL